MSKKLILVAAPPACGKTYVSELIAKSIGHIVYLDKDDLADLLRASFSASGKEMDMDGEFYINNLRPSEYSTILNIAFSALRFENIVLVNAPFGKEVRDTEYIKILKDKANKNGAQLLLIWVAASEAICYERMKKRISDRDILKLNNWEEYVKTCISYSFTINFTPPYELEEKNAVDKFLIIDSNNEATMKRSLDEVLKTLNEKV